jgi:hypothetical protein
MKSLLLIVLVVPLSFITVPTISVSYNVKVRAYWLEVAEDTDGGCWWDHTPWETCGAGDFTFRLFKGSLIASTDVADYWGPTTDYDVTPSEWNDVTWVADHDLEYEFKLDDFDGIVFEEPAWIAKVTITGSWSGTMLIDMTDAKILNQMYNVLYYGKVVITYVITFRRCYDVNCNGPKMYFAPG